LRERNWLTPFCTGISQDEDDENLVAVIREMKTSMEGVTRSIVQLGDSVRQNIQTLKESFRIDLAAMKEDLYTIKAHNIRASALHHYLKIITSTMPWS
jgi:hypothetical protein